MTLWTPALAQFPLWVGLSSLAAIGMLLGWVMSPLLVTLPAAIDPGLTQPFSTRQRLGFVCLCAVLTTLAGWRYGLNFTGLAAGGCLLTLALLAWIDARTGYLPDILTLSLLWAGLLVNLQHTFVPLPDAVIGAVAGYGFFWLIYQGFLLITQREGLGYGDFKLLAALGAWLGWAALPNLVLLAAISALAITLARRLRSGNALNQALHFGPYLALAGAYQLLWQA